MVVELLSVSLPIDQAEPNPTQLAVLTRFVIQSRPCLIHSIDLASGNVRV